MQVIGFNTHDIETVSFNRVSPLSLHRLVTDLLSLNSPNIHRIEVRNYWGDKCYEVQQATT